MEKIELEVNSIEVYKKGEHIYFSCVYTDDKGELKKLDVRQDITDNY